MMRDWGGGEGEFRQRLKLSSYAARAAVMPPGEVGGLDRIGMKASRKVRDNDLIVLSKPYFPCPGGDDGGESLRPKS